MDGGGNRFLPAEAFPLFQEGIGLVLSRWSALQLAVENEWGGRDSRRKVELLCSDIFTWFTQNKEQLYIDDLEMILEEAMLLLNTQVDDGSIEEVAEELIFMHEECVDGNFSSIERLRQIPLPRVAHARQAESDDEEEDGDVENGREDMGNDMMVDAIQQPRLVVVNQPNPEARAEAEDGWVQVTSRRSRAIFERECAKQFAFRLHQEKETERNFAANFKDSSMIPPPPFEQQFLI